MNGTLLKLGGELLEHPAAVAALGRTIARARGPLVVVHGGGRAIDAALAQAGVEKQQVDGLRVTDARTLDVVVPVLAGTINVRLVAAVNAAGGQAVGLTGADAGVAPVTKAPPYRTANGAMVDLGLVGRPSKAGRPVLISVLLARGFVPVVACLGASRSGRLFNVNADTLAASLAVRLGASRLLIAGGTSGVLDAQGATIPLLDARGIRTLVKARTVSAGMVAKLAACQAAARGGVRQVAVVDGHDMKALGHALQARGPLTGPAGTRITR